MFVDRCRLSVATVWSEAFSNFSHFRSL